MSADWYIPAESPLAGLAYAVAQEKVLTILKQVQVAGPASLIPPHGFVALAMRTIMEESELRAGGPGDAERVDLAVDGILDVLKNIPLDQSSVPPEAFGDDAYFQSLSPEKKAQFTRVELVRLVGQLRAMEIWMERF